MFVPKVIFKKIPTSIEMDAIYHLLFENRWGWADYILEEHPALKKIQSIKAEKRQLKFLKDYIVNFREQNKEDIKKNKDRIKKAWNKIEKEALIHLREIIGINWPPKRSKIRAMFSINPINPRFLDEWTFSIFYKFSDERANMTILHECCHFLYFEKWKKLYPNSNKATFESPHLEWHLSEILAPVILNDPRIRKMTKYQAGFYPAHRKVKINRIKVPEYFLKLYNKYVIKDQQNFDTFLKKSYSVIKKNKKIFNKI